MNHRARERATQALRAHAPELAGVSLAELGQGLDNTAFLAGDLVLRVGDADSVVREARLLDVVAARVPLPVPAPRFVDEEAGVLAYIVMPGVRCSTAARRTAAHTGWDGSCAGYTRSTCRWSATS